MINSFLKIFEVSLPHEDPCREIKIKDVTFFRTSDFLTELAIAIFVLNSCMGFIRVSTESLAVGFFIALFLGLVYLLPFGKPPFWAFVLYFLFAPGISSPAYFLQEYATVPFWILAIARFSIILELLLFMFVILYHIFTWEMGERKERLLKDYEEMLKFTPTDRPLLDASIKAVHKYENFNFTVTYSGGEHVSAIVTF
jgi:hypothetical protein